MLLALLPSVIVALGAAATAPCSAATPAQARLAEALADADSIVAVRADPARATVTFHIARAGERYAIVVASGPGGEVTRVTTLDQGRGPRALGPLSWLADAMAREAAVTRLEVGADGGVTVVTCDDARYAARPAREASGTLEWARAQARRSP